MIWALFAKDGELYALRGSWPDIKKAESQGEEYLHGAATCGHPSAPAWVRARLPFRIRLMSESAALVLVEDEGTPVLDREP